MKKLRKSPYSFKTYLNDFGDTVVYIKKGKIESWIFNISDGIIDVSTPGANREELGLKEDSNGYVMVVGPNTVEQTVVDQLNYVCDFIDHIKGISR